ncbi:MAG: hypothetical protein FJX34_04120 [Alphaproteobacteria bacterium]|nr:hypothetical protein [Alphaproteobacteria bacterium]
MKKFFLCFLLLLQCSCVTKYLWSGKSYQEKISRFFVGSDGRYVVLVGDEYHYILTDDSGVLKTILSLQQRDSLSINSEKTKIHLNSQNELNGKIVMKGFVGDMAPEDRQLLLLRGIIGGGSNYATISIPVSGRRYAAKYLNQSITSSNTSYTITIYYSNSNVLKNASKVAVTPIAVGVDAMLLIGKVVIGAFDL